MWPSMYTWDAVMANISAFLQEPLVMAGILFYLALLIVPRMVGAMRGALDVDEEDPVEHREDLVAAKRAGRKEMYNGRLMVRTWSGWWEYDEVNEPLNDEDEDD